MASCSAKGAYKYCSLWWKSSLSSNVMCTGLGRRMENALRKGIFSFRLRKGSHLLVFHTHHHQLTCAIISAQIFGHSFWPARSSASRLYYVEVSPAYSAAELTLQTPTSHEPRKKLFDPGIWTDLLSSDYIYVNNASHHVNLSTVPYRAHLSTVTGQRSKSLLGRVP